MINMTGFGRVKSHATKVSKEIVLYKNMGLSDIRYTSK